MRHFLCRLFVPEPVSVPRLPRGLQTPRSRLHSVSRSRSANRLSPPRGLALGAEPLPAITTDEETKLDSTPLAAREPVLRRRQETPRRRFLDMELEP